MDLPDPGDHEGPVPPRSERISIDPNDPKLIERLVEELKSQGVLDDIRKECLAEVDTKPAYQNLQQRLSASVDKFLNKQTTKFSPSLNKNQLRNHLRRYIQEERFVEEGIERIVDQTVNPKIYSAIEPLVESIVYKFLGVEKTEGGQHQEPDFPNGNYSSGASFNVHETTRPNMFSPDKMSTISSEDIEMAGGSKTAKDESSDEDGSKHHPMSDASSPGPGRRGNFSPLTPDRKGSSATNRSKFDGDSGSDIEMTTQLRDNVSPLTPPLRMARVTPMDNTSEIELPPLPPPPGDQSPRTPPLPPQRVFHEEEISASLLQGGDDDDDDEEEDRGNMSPVSDTEFADLSPPNESPETPDESSLPSPPRDEVTPPPPPPPPPMDDAMIPPPPPEIPIRRPRSPITSPIESSSDEMDSTAAGASGMHQEKSGIASKSASSMSASDISDTDFACQSEGEKESHSTSEEAEEEDLEKLERARAELQAKLALEEDSDEGEVHSEEEEETEVSAVAASAPPQPEEEVAETKEVEEEEKPKEEDSSMSPVSDEGHHSDNPKKDDDDEGAGGAAGAGERAPSFDDGNHGGGSGGGQKEEKTDRESSKRSHSQDERSKERKSHHSSSSRDDKHHRRHSSSSSKSKKRDKERHESRKDEKREEGNGSGDSKEKKEKAKEREKKKEKERIRLEKIEEKINRTDMLKSEKFKAFDMFAPKTPKPNLSKSIISAVTPRFERSNSGGLTSLIPSSPMGGKAPPVFGIKNLVSTPSHSTKLSKSSNNRDIEIVKSSSSSKHDDRGSHHHHHESKSGKSHSSSSKSSKAINSSDLYREMALSSASPIFERRVLPELPVPKCDGDKRKQHESDVNDTKLLLEKARQKRLAEQQREKDLKKKRKSSTSSSAVHQQRPESPNNGEATMPQEKVKSSESSKISTSKSSRKDRRPSESKNRRKVLSSDDESDEEWRKSEANEKSKKVEKKTPSKARRFADSSSGEEEVVAESKVDNPVMTRMLAQHTKATALLKEDPTLPLFHGFENDEAAKFDRLESINVDDLSDSSDIEELVPPLPNKKVDTDFVYLDGLANVEKSLQALKPFGGKPKVVRAVPNWLEKKLSTWSLRRQDVEIIFPNEIKKIRNKRKIMIESEFDRKCGVVSTNVVDAESSKKMRIEDILAEQMPDIVTSNTPEPTVAAENSVVENVIESDDPDVEMESVEQKSSKKIETAEQIQPAKESGKVGDKYDDDRSLTDIEDFHGFHPEDVPTTRLELPIISVDTNGNTFGMTDFLDVEDSDEDNSLAGKIEILFTKSLQEHYMRLLKDEPKYLEILRNVAIYESVVEQNSAPVQQQPQHQQQPTHFSGLQEVSDEFLADDIHFDVTPAPKQQKQPRSGRKPPAPKAPTPARNGGRKSLVKQQTPSSTLLTSEAVFPLPPSPISSPSEGLIDYNASNVASTLAVNPPIFTATPSHMPLNHPHGARASLPPQFTPAPVYGLPVAHPVLNPNPPVDFRAASRASYMPQFPQMATVPRPELTAAHLQAFRDAVSALFMQRGTEALPLAQIRKHVLTTTRLTDSQMMACIRIMTSENKMLQSADYFCLV